MRVTLNETSQAVYLLYALYPCDEWEEFHHGPSSECDCEDFLEGVFSSTDKARAYIPEYLDGRHAQLKWSIEDRRSEHGYYDEYARADKNLVYHVRRYKVDKWDE